MNIVRLCVLSLAILVITGCSQNEIKKVNVVPNEVRSNSEWAIAKDKAELMSLITTAESPLNRNMVWACEVKDDPKPVLNQLRIYANGQGTETTDGFARDFNWNIFNEKGMTLSYIYFYSPSLEFTSTDRNFSKILFSTNKLANSPLKVIFHSDKGYHYSCTKKPAEDELPLLNEINGYILVSSKNYNGDGTSRTTQMNLDVANRIIQRDSKGYIEQYSYNQDGLITQLDYGYIEEDKKFNKRRVYRRDVDGNVSTRTFIRSPYKQAKGITTYTYKNNRLKNRQLYQNNSVYSDGKYFYDKDGMLVGYRQSAQHSCMYRYELSEKSAAYQVVQLCGPLNSLSEIDFITLKKTRRYDLNGNLVEEIFDSRIAEIESGEIAKSNLVRRTFEYQKTDRLVPNVQRFEEINEPAGLRF